jgi:hypothetical protein
MSKRHKLVLWLKLVMLSSILLAGAVVITVYGTQIILLAIGVFSGPLLSLDKAIGLAKIGAGLGVLFGMYVLWGD